MRIRVWKSLARGVVLESLRRKDLWVVAILGFLILLSAGALGFFGIDGLEVFAKDLAFTVLGMFSTIVGVITASRVMPDEIKNRTLYPLLARPVTRFDLVMGKLLGAIAVTWTAFGILLVLTTLAMMTFHVHFELVMLQYIAAKMMGLAVLCAVGVTLSLYMTPSAAATMGFVLAFGVSMFSRGLLMASADVSGVQLWATKLVNGLLPQYGLFDMGGRAANVGWAPVPMWVLGVLFLYAVVYSSAMVVLGWKKFQKQAV